MASWENKGVKEEESGRREGEYNGEGGKRPRSEEEMRQSLFKEFEELRALVVKIVGEEKGRGEQFMGMNDAEFDGALEAHKKELAEVSDLEMEVEKQQIAFKLR